MRGCSVDSAPLGILTYDSDKGGMVVANTRNSKLYYIKPQPGCKADASFLDWRSLEQSFRGITED